MEGASRMSGGSGFHKRGAATAKARSPFWFSLEHIFSVVKENVKTFLIVIYLAHYTQLYAAHSINAMDSNASSMLCSTSALPSTQLTSILPPPLEHDVGMKGSALRWIRSYLTKDSNNLFSY